MLTDKVVIENKVVDEQKSSKGMSFDHFVVNATSIGVSHDPKADVVVVTFDRGLYGALTSSGFLAVLLRREKWEPQRREDFTSKVVESSRAYALAAQALYFLAFSGANYRKLKLSDSVYSPQGDSVVSDVELLGDLGKVGFSVS